MRTPSSISGNRKPIAAAGKKSERAGEGTAFRSGGYVEGNGLVGDNTKRSTVGRGRQRDRAAADGPRPGISRIRILQIDVVTTRLYAIGRIEGFGASGRAGIDAVEAERTTQPYGHLISECPAGISKREFYPRLIRRTKISRRLMYRHCLRWYRLRRS